MGNTHSAPSTTTRMMTGRNKKLAEAVKGYYADLARMHASGGATGERSSYGPLANLLNAVGDTLKPKVFCVGELADQGAGHPDFGLYDAKDSDRNYISNFIVDVVRSSSRRGTHCDEVTGRASARWW